MNCMHCGKDIGICHPNRKYCDDTCRSLSYGRTVLSTEKTIKCRLCNYSCAGNITQHVSNKHGLTLKDYQYQYNLTTEDCFGEQYLKNQSTKLKGEKNPAYKHDGKFSPFSEKFIKYTSTENSIQEVKQKVQDTKNKNKSHPTRLNYWTNKGHSETESKLLLAEFQTKFSLQKCIRMYGTEVGTAIHTERQINWQTTMNNKSQEEKDSINKRKISNGYSISKAEIELLDILKNYNIETQFILKNEYRSFLYDFRIGNKIIEYYGDFWHCNPNIYSESYINKRTKLTATEQWNKDNIKEQVAINNGYELYIIWEQDFKKNKEQTIKDLLEWVNL